MRKRISRYTSLLLIMWSVVAYSQPKLADGIAAVVGDQIILVSDIQIQYESFSRQNYGMEGLNECLVFNELLFEKLLLHQAEIDSIAVDDTEVEMNLDRRLQQLEMQMGGKNNVERYYEKSYVEIKEEMRPLMKNQLTAQQMQASVIREIDVTPGEVRTFFEKIPQDSLPLINTSVELAQIVKFPEVSREAEEAAIERLNGLKERIETGTSFSSMAIVYSEDPGSSKNGGKYEGIKRGQFVKEFEAVAFNLKKGQISDPFKTEYGYHIVQLLEKRGEELDVRHILIKPKYKPEDLEEAKHTLDSIRVVIESGELTFEEAAREYSEDEATRFNGGILVNLSTGDTRWEINNLDRQIYNSIAKMESGEVSQPQFMRTDDQKEGFRLILLRRKIEPHRANLKDDYQYIKIIAQQDKQTKVMDKWISKKVDETYIMITPDLLIAS